jgi:hypothetical protein
MTRRRMPATLLQRIDTATFKRECLNSILKRYVVHTLPKYSFLVDQSYQNLLRVTFMPHG